MTWNWKWVGIIVLFVIGVLAGIVAIFWLTEPIHALPTILGGHHHHRGRYQRRGEALIVFAVVVLGAATYLTIRMRRAQRAPAPAAGPAAPAPAAPPNEGDSADALLSTSSPDATTDNT